MLLRVGEADMERQVRLGIEVLRGGGVVAFPTDTVYGLGASVFGRKGVERVFRVKERPPHLPLPVLVADVSDLAGLVAEVPKLALKLAEHFWPGGLTLVLRRGPLAPPWVTAGGETVAVRIPDHPLALALVRGLGAPLTGTSANRSGQPSPVTAAEVRQQLGDRVDLFMEGGRPPRGLESTVLDISGAAPRLLREGTIARLELERAIGRF